MSPCPVSVKNAAARGWLAPVLACLLAVTGVFGLDALLFRTGFYTHWLQPDSSTGLFELILRREQRAQEKAGDNLVLTLGNSRFGYSRKVIDQEPVAKPYVFRDAGVAGSDPRVWFFMLRDLDPTARRYRAIVFGVDDYEDEDRLFDPANDPRDLHYVIARLRLGDVVDFARSFPNWEQQWAALRGGLLKGIVFQSDILEFLTNPLKRIAYVQLCDQGFAGWSYDYLETTRSMAGLGIDWSTLQVTFPPGADDDQRGSVKSFLAHAPDPQTGKLAAFFRTWLGRTIDRYRGSPTKLIFTRLPRGPIPRPDGLVKKKSASIRELAARPNVVLANEHAFDALERPEFFRDGMHLNREGINRFSVMLAAEVARILGPPEQDKR